MVMADDTEGYKFRAFISYSHADKVWVDWIHKTLETYIIPRHLVGTEGRDGPVPKRLFPIFRDREELPSAHDLSEQISDALKQSAYMIVICSRNSAKSHWVNEEIIAFKRLGRENRILAFIIDGEPNATDKRKPKKECFPKALRYALGPDGNLSDNPTEPIAADARSKGDGREKATLKIISGLLGIAFDKLAQRDRQRQKERIRTAITIASTVAVMIGIGAGAWWWENAPHTYRYRSFTTRYGVPEGVGNLNALEARQAYEAFAITKQRGKVIELRLEDNSQRVKTMDGDAVITETDLIGAAVVRIDYVGERGFVASLYDARNKVLGTKEYTYVDRARSGATVTLKTTAGEVRTLDASGSTLPGMNGDTSKFKSAITRFRLNFDKKGRLTSRLYQTAMGDPAADALGSFGTHYEHDAEGLPLRLRNLDSDGHFIPLKSGVSEIAITYDKGMIKTLSWLDDAKAPALNDLGVTVTRLSRDAHGNLTQVRYLGADGGPTTQKQICASGVNYSYGLMGERTEQSYSGTDQKPVLTCDQGAAKITFAYDKQGYLSTQTYIGLDGKPILGRHDGVARIAKTHDLAGNVTSEAYFGVDGQPMLRKDVDYAKVVRTYDAAGQMLSQSYLGAKGQAILSGAARVARTTWVYDENGQVTDEAYLGTDGKPHLHNQTGVARTHSGFARGNETERGFFGVDGKPVTDMTVGAARVVSAYDNRGNRIRVDYYGTDGAPTRSAVLGYARAIWKYDDRGNQTEESYFDTSGKAMPLSSNVAIVRHAFDDAGNLIEEAFFNTAEQPTASRNVGYSRATWKYDKRSNPIEARYFKVDGTPMLNWVGGFAKVTWAYDARGNRIEQRYFGENGESVIDWETNVARTSWVYDTHGNITEIRHFDSKGAPTMSWVKGYARATMAYDAQGNLIEERYYGPEDKPLLNAMLGYSRIAMSYDARGRQVEETYFGIDDKPTPSKAGGVARIHYGYDDRGNCVRWAFFGSGFDPATEATTGTAVYVKTYDIDGGPAKIEGFNANAVPVKPRGVPKDPRRS
jgi:hypothetical protein